MSGVFINYRAADNPLGAAGIHDALAAKFGSDKVFRDCVSPEAGVNYPDAIREALANADVLVSIVGPCWLTLTDPNTGERLIDREHDWVRRELIWADERHICIVPVLLADPPTHALHPAADELPPDLRWFAHIQAFPFSQRRFRIDLDRLAARLTALAPSLTTNGRTPDIPTFPSPADFSELVTALEAVPSVQNDSTRALVVSRLRPTISGAVPHYVRRRAHVIGILTTCLNYDQGIVDLMEAIADIEQADSLPFQRLLQILRRHFPETTFGTGSDLWSAPERGA